MTLDHAHDILLVLTALSLLLAIAGVVLRRTPREPGCPRCLYRHGMADVGTCPECGYKPASPAAWLRSRPRVPRGVRVRNMTSLPVLALVLTTIAVLHGRWARIMPTPLLVESVGLLRWGTAVGQDRVASEIERRDLDEGEANRLVRIAIEEFGRWESLPLDAPANLDEEVVNSWRLALAELARSLRVGRDGVIASDRRPFPVGGMPVSGDYFASRSSVLQDPKLQAILIEAIRTDSRRGMRAQILVHAMGPAAAPLAPALFQVLGSSRWTSPPGDQTLAGALFHNAPALKAVLETAEPAHRQRVVDLASIEVYMMGEGALDVLWEFLSSPESDGLDTRQLRETIDLQFPRGPDQWRRRAATPPSQQPLAPSPP